MERDVYVMYGRILHEKKSVVFLFCLDGWFRSASLFGSGALLAMLSIRCLVAQDGGLVNQSVGRVCRRFCSRGRMRRKKQYVWGMEGKPGRVVCCWV